MEEVFMKVIVKKCNGGEWYGKALNKVDPKFAYLLNGRKKAYIYTSDADVI